MTKDQFIAWAISKGYTLDRWGQTQLESHLWYEVEYFEPILDEWISTHIGGWNTWDSEKATRQAIKEYGVSGIKYRVISVETVKRIVETSGLNVD